MKATGTIQFSARASEWVIECTPDVAMRMKRIFPRMVQSGGTRLTVKSTPEVANDLEWLLLRFPMAASEVDLDLLTAAASDYREKLERLEKLMEAPQLEGVLQMAYPPRQYQMLAAALYLEQGHLLLGDVVGLGKTISAIATFTDLRTLPAVVVVKAHLPKQWREEIMRFIPAARVHIIKSTSSYPLPPAEVYIVTYSKLSHWWGDLAVACKSVVFDEVQELRICESAKYKAAKSLTSVVPYRLGMSATPIYNYGGEAWSIFNLLAPDCLGTSDEFFREWCMYGPGGKHVVKSPEALGSYLRSQKLMLRRTRKEVGRELPSIIRYIQEAEFDRTVYEKGTSAAAQLAQIILSGTFIERGQAARQFDLEMRQATGLAKAPYVAELVRMLIESGEKVLLGGWHRVVYDVWGERLADLKPAFFTGHESAAQKEAARGAFIRGDTDLLIMSLRSGDGTNGLQDVCSVVVLGELDWTPAVHEQFIGRLARDGQTESVQVFIPVAPVGSDPTMASVLGLKQAQATGIIDLGETVGVDFVETDQQRLVQLAKDYLKGRAA